MGCEVDTSSAVYKQYRLQKVTEKYPELQKNYLKNSLLLTHLPFRKDWKMEVSTNVESAGDLYLEVLAFWIIMKEVVL